LLPFNRAFQKEWYYLRKNLFYFHGKVLQSQLFFVLYEEVDIDLERLENVERGKT